MHTRRNYFTSKTKWDPNQTTLTNMAYSTFPNSVLTNLRLMLGLFSCQTAIEGISLLQRQCRMVFENLLDQHV